MKFDFDDQYRPGWKFAEYELKGVPLRVAIGMRDIENNTVEIARRDNLTKESVSIDGIETYIENLLIEIQSSIYEKAFAFRAANTFEVNSWEEFCVKIEEGGFLMAHWEYQESRIIFV